MWHKKQTRTVSHQRVDQPEFRQRMSQECLGRSRNTSPSVPVSSSAKPSVGVSISISRRCENSTVTVCSSLSSMWAIGEWGRNLSQVRNEPRSGGTLLTYLRYARDRGRLSDLAAQPFRPRLQFERLSTVTPQRWWNGLLYSQYQLLALSDIEGLLYRAHRRRLRDGRVVTRLPEPHHLLRARTARSVLGPSCWPRSKRVISRSLTRNGYG